MHAKSPGQRLLFVKCNSVAYSFENLEELFVADKMTVICLKRVSVVLFVENI